MPQIIITILIWFASSLVSRVLFGAGLAIYSYVKIDEYMTHFMDTVVSEMSRLPASFLQLAALAGFDKFLSIVLSALTVATYIATMKLMVGKAG